MNQEIENTLSEFEGVPLIYGTFKERVFASLLAWLILLPLAAIDWFNKSDWKSQILLIVVFIASVSYKVLFEYRFGATIGKKAMGLMVVNKELQRVNLKEVLVRNIFDITWKTFFFIISLIIYRSAEFINITSNQEFVSFSDSLINSNPYLIIYLFVIIVEVAFILSDKKRRALHDRMGDTLVIKTK